MKLLSYNILNGGEGRADPLAEVIEANRPDIVTLIEADHPQVVERIAGRLKMDFIIGHGQNHSVAILSRMTIKCSINHGLLITGFTGNFLQAVVTRDGSVDLRVIAIHLHSHARDSDETTREQQIRAILQQTADDRAANREHVIMGDFNANAPTQRILISQAKSSTRDEYAANGGMIPRRVIHAMLHHGYIDTLHHLHPEQADTTGSFSTQNPQQRVDYIFTHGIDGARIREAWIEQDRLATYASDHYPVGVRID